MTREEAIKTLVPELKESEDERMLREIKRYIKEQGDKPTGLPNGTVAVSDMIAWLEKQGNPADKIEPTWKPSEEQMTAVEAAYSVLNSHDTWGEDEHLPTLMSLINDLQKLL